MDKMAKPNSNFTNGHHRGYLMTYGMVIIVKPTCISFSHMKTYREFHVGPIYSVPKGLLCNNTINQNYNL